MKRLLPAVAVLLGLASAAHAGQSYDATGVATGMSDTTRLALEEGHVIISMTSSYDRMEMADMDNPLNRMSGTCVGTAELIGMTAQGGGNCLFSDPDGDMLTIRWTATGVTGDGALVGDWVFTGGTGALDGIAGGGGFRSLTDPETGAFENRISGGVSLP